jgi:hypothetical protein
MENSPRLLPGDIPVTSYVLAAERRQSFEVASTPPQRGGENFATPLFGQYPLAAVAKICGRSAAENS